MGQVCGWTEKTQIKSLETVGVVRDNAETGQVESSEKQMSGNATYQELSPHARSADSTCWITLRRAYSSQSTRTIRTLEPSNAARQPSRHLADAETPREHRGLS